jgi:hypothetical protein
MVKKKFSLDIVITLDYYLDNYKLLSHLLEIREFEFMKMSPLNDNTPKLNSNDFIEGAKESLQYAGTGYYLSYDTGRNYDLLQFMPKVTRDSLTKIFCHFHDFITVESITRVTNIFEILNNKNLRGINLRFEPFVTKPFFKELYKDFTKLRPDFKTKAEVSLAFKRKFGIDFQWFAVIPPKGSSLRWNTMDIKTFETNTFDPFPSDDIFLDAPVYRAERLPSGATLIQLTKDLKVFERDEEYIKAWIDFYNYLESKMLPEYRDTPIS